MEEKPNIKIPENKDQEKCIIDWELHHKALEKKYGKRKIDTEYKFKPKK